MSNPKLPSMSQSEMMEPTTPRLLPKNVPTRSRHDRRGFPTSSRVVARILPNRADPNGYYEALGLTADASLNEIKQTYRAWARLCHPDGSEPDAEQYAFLTHVYETFMDPDEKLRYDSTPPDNAFISVWEINELMHDHPEQFDAISEDNTPDRLEKDDAKLLEEIVESLGLNNWSFYGDEKYEDIAQEWTRYFLEAAWATQVVTKIRIGVTDQDEKLHLQESLGFRVFFFAPYVEPSYWIAFWIMNSLRELLKSH